MSNTEVEDNNLGSHYMKPHWERATPEILVWIGDVKEWMVALINLALEIISMVENANKMTKIFPQINYDHYRRRWVVTGHKVQELPFN